MLISLVVPDSVSSNSEKFQIAKMIFQSQINRLAVGELRYGSANRRQKYLTRLKKELAAYTAAGNAEQLINIANYCILEWIAPEHPKHHFDPTVDSVTRRGTRK